MPVDKLRWGILGTGRIVDLLLPAFRGVAHSRVVAVASRDPERARTWAAERGVPVALGSYEELVASNEVNAVYIALPNALHREWAVRAAQAGKHVLCEKPLAVNATEARQMAAAAEAHGVKLMEAFMYRFHPQIARLRQLVADGAIGELKQIRASFGFSIRRADDIRLSRELGGGALLDVGCYCVNVARLLTGAEPTAAAARAVWGPSGVDESFAGVLEFPRGVLAVIDCSFHIGASLQQWLSISGTQGRIIVTHPFRVGEEPVTLQLDNLDAMGRAESVQLPGASEYWLMVQHFTDAVLDDRPLDYPPQDSVANMQAIDALLAAALSARTP